MGEITIFGLLYFCGLMILAWCVGEIVSDN